MKVEEKFKSCLAVSLLINTALVVAFLFSLVPFKSWGVLVFFSLMSLHLGGNLISSIFVFNEQRSWLKNMIRFAFWEITFPFAIKES